MSNGNFIIQNGLTVGPVTIDAATGNITTTGTINGSGGGGGGSAAQYEFGPFAPPQSSWFTVQKSDNLTVNATDISLRGMNVLITGADAIDKVIYLKRSIASWGTNWKVTARLVGKCTVGQYPSLGLAIYDDNTGRGALIISQNSNSESDWILQNRNNFDQYGGGAGATGSVPATWFQLERSGGTMYYRLSTDGIDWQQKSDDYQGTFSYNFPNGKNPTSVGICFTSGAGTNWMNAQGALCTYYEDPDYPAS